MMRTKYSLRYIRTSSFLQFPAIKAQSVQGSAVAYNSVSLLTFLSSRRTYNLADPKVVQTENPPVIYWKWLQVQPFLLLPFGSQNHIYLLFGIQHRLAILGLLHKLHPGEQRHILAEYWLRPGIFLCLPEPIQHSKSLSASRWCGCYSFSRFQP